MPPSKRTLPLLVIYIIVNMTGNVNKRLAGLDKLLRKLFSPGERSTDYAPPGNYPEPGNPFLPGPGR